MPEPVLAEVLRAAPDLVQVVGLVQVGVTAATMVAVETAVTVAMAEAMVATAVEVVGVRPVHVRVRSRTTTQ